MKKLSASGQFIAWPVLHSLDDFQYLSTRWDRWISGRIRGLDFLNPSLASDLRARSIGIYSFSKPSRSDLTKFATRLGILYQEAGPQIEEMINNGETWPFGNVGPDAAKVLKKVVRLPHPWARTLRADIVLDPSSDNISIVEVNSDNVGGIEDLLLQLGFARAANAPISSTRVNAYVRRIHRNLRDWIFTNYDIFRRARGNHLFPARGEVGIALLCQDREISAFLSHFLYKELLKHGLRVMWGRPEDLRYRKNRVELKVGKKQWAPVHVILRDWLFKEMFHDDDVYKSLRPVFETFVEAVAAQQVLVLNPMRERLLFSKEILAHLRNPKRFCLSQDSKRFVENHVASTDVVNSAAFASTVGKVFKPVGESGGRGVICNELPNAQDLKDLRTGTWVCQPTLPCERHLKWLRHYDREGRNSYDSLENLFVVHGVVVHGYDLGKFRLTGILTRGGPRPVVNWSRGAQIFAGMI